MQYALYSDFLGEASKTITVSGGTGSISKYSYNAGSNGYIDFSWPDGSPGRGTTYTVTIDLFADSKTDTKSFQIIMDHFPEFNPTSDSISLHIG